MKNIKPYIVMLCVISILFFGCQSIPIYNESGQNDIPGEYSETIKDYKKLVDFRLSEDFESGYNSGKFAEINEDLKADLNISNVNADNSYVSLQYKWDNMIADMFGNIEAPTVESFGYILKDLNGDGTRELIWVSSDYSVIFAVFTVRDGKPQLLDAFWSRYRCVVLDSGTLYTLGSGGADTFTYEKSEIDLSEETGLKAIKQFGSENGNYYETVDGDSVTIDKARFDELLSEYPFEFGETWADNTMYLLKDIE